MRALLRRLWGAWHSDAAYQRYVAHWCQAHAGGEARPLDRAEFFRRELARRWDGVRRCC